MSVGTAKPTAAARADGSLRRRSRKQRPATEVVCEAIFRPAATVVVRALLPLRVPPPALVAAGAIAGLAAALAIGVGRLPAAAVLLQLKTVLDNADGQLARASGRVTALGRYLDSESDLLVNVAVFVALGAATGKPWLTAAAFLVLTSVLSVDFNLDRLYRRERGEHVDPGPPAEGRVGRLLERVYDLVYAPQDRVVERLVERRLRRLRVADDHEARIAYHDRLTIELVANYGLSTQLAVLGVCLAVGRPSVYLWLVLACGATLVPMAWRRERRVLRLMYERATAPGNGLGASDVPAGSTTLDTVT